MLIPFPGPEAEKHPLVASIYQQIIDELGFGMVPNLFRSMAHHPEFLQANWVKFRGVVLHGSLPRTLKEMIGVVISHHNKSNYALQVHLHSLSALGFSQVVAELIKVDIEACPLPARDRAILSFGLRAGTAPQSLSAEDWTRLRGFGLEDAEIYEVIATANLFAGVNQYTDAIQLEIDAL